MRKSILLLAVLLTALGANAQRHNDDWMFNHFSVGAGLGIINGAYIEMAVPVTPYAAIRGGYNFMNNLIYGIAVVCPCTATGAIVTQRIYCIYVVIYVLHRYKIVFIFPDKMRQRTMLNNHNCIPCRICIYINSRVINVTQFWIGIAVW